jgi:hypothetical protein
MSDDDTVNLQNVKEKDTDVMEWQTVEGRNKQYNRKSIAVSKDHVDKGKGRLNKPTPIPNPYISKQEGKRGDKSKQGNKGKASLTSHLETVKGKQRNPNKNTIRVTTAFTPRTAGTGDYRRVAQEILTCAKEFDEEILLLPWDNNSTLGRTC